MTEQTTLWQDEQNSSDFAELCNALYEREINALTLLDISSPQVIQGRLRSLPYYIKRTAYLMIQCQSPLDLDVQNASWSAKQATTIPLSGQEVDKVNQWYINQVLTLGLVVPIAEGTRIVLDSIDRIDEEKQRFRTNVYGWFSLTEPSLSNSLPSDQLSNGTLAESAENLENKRLLKPTKRVMTAACTGHCWINNTKANPIIPSLRELILSCGINWRNFKHPIIF